MTNGSGAHPPAREQARPVLKWLLIGCGAPVLLGGLCFAGFVVAAFRSLGSSEACRAAMEKARAHPDLAETLGEPVEQGWFVTGSIRAGADVERVANLSIPLSGPKGQATLTVEGIQSGPFWHFPRLELRTPGGETLDLRNPPAIEWGPLASDSFDDPASGWPTGRNAAGSRAYEGGRLVLEVHPGAGLVAPSPGTFADGTLGVEVSRLSGAEAWMGIVVRQQESRLGYGFFVDGQSYLGDAAGAGWTLPPFMMPGAQPLPRELAGRASYRIEVEAAGPSLTFSIDGQVLWTVDAATYADGRVALLAAVPPEGSAARIAFDDLVVRH